MAPTLTYMPTDRLDALIKHPFHRENGERLVGFIKDLRECHSAEDFVTFQRELLTATLAVNLARAERSRVIKRLRKRESLPVDAPELKKGGAAGRSATATGRWSMLCATWPTAA